MIYITKKERKVGLKHLGGDTAGRPEPRSTSRITRSEYRMSRNINKIEQICAESQIHAVGQTSLGSPQSRFGDGP